jgi:hypothetical protein
LKVWGLGAPREIKFNQKKTTPFYARRRGELYESYITLTPTLVAKGTNKLSIVGPPFFYSVRIRNYLGKLGANGLFIVFNSSTFLKNYKWSIKRLSLSGIFFLFLLLMVWLLFSILAKRYFGFSLRIISLYYFLSYAPCFLSFFVAYFILEVSPYRLIISPEFFTKLSILLIVPIQWAVLFYKITKEIRISFQKNTSKLKDKAGVELNSMAKVMINFFTWLENSTYAERLILIFIVLLMLAAFLLILNLEVIAEQMANLAYLLLVIGLIMKVLELLKEK